MNSSVRTSQSLRSRVGILLLIIWGLALSPRVSLATGQSVEDFLKTKPRWSKLVGTIFRIEGRVATGAGTILKLNKLPLLFVSEEELPELPGPDLAVEVVGRLQKRETGVFEFELLSVKKIESDTQRVSRLRVDLPRDDPQPWYELGDWAMNRVRFYQSGRALDRQLAQDATGLYRMAIRKERTRMSSPTYNQLKELALKSERYGLDDEFKLPLLYEAHYQSWHNASVSASSAELAAIASRIASELPDAKTPVEEFDADFVSEWKKGPVLFYQNAPDALRPQLHRLLYQQVMRESIEMDAATDGRNGVEIAARLTEYLPEFTTLADTYRRKNLEWKINHVTELSREEASSLKQELIAAGEEARAAEVFRQWFQVIETRLRQRGATGLVELASNYEELFDDEQTAVELLLEADRVKPGSSYVAERLEGYGFMRVDGRWRRQGEIKSGDTSPIEKAIRNGQVIRGMTSAHVRKSIGPPDSVSRVLTSREVLEYWVYRTPSGAGMSVRLSRPLNRHEGLVRKVFDLPAR